MPIKLFVWSLLVACVGLGQTGDILRASELAGRVQSLFAEKCLACHGADEAEAGLRLDSREHAIRELESGNSAIVPGHPERSTLLLRVSSNDAEVRMPPDGEPLTEVDLQLVRKWISTGADWNRHWAYEPLKSGSPPKTQSQFGGRDPIDAYVEAKLEKLNIAPSAAASRHKLIRRLYLDLLGVLPKVDEVDDFINDATPDAYEKLVDRLLASPHFGERWGRHWLDKARYADSNGFEKDSLRPNAWRFRDWVIHAINDDLGFDHFTRDQLAGDLIENGNPAQILATAFNRQTLTNTEGGTDHEQWRVAAVMDRTETLGTVWLGLTVGCARCHNHKYDQLSQREYYQLFAFFNNGDETTREIPARWLPPDSTKVRVITERTKNRRESHILRRGEFKEKLESVTTGVPTIVPGAAVGKNGDRRDLVEWLVNGDNSLVLRVTTNHIWQHLFGFGLVRTPNDFGVRGEMPSHLELLDYLALQYQKHDWSRKAMIRKIVLSATYRQRSAHRHEIADKDPGNRLLYRQNRFRVEAEIVRDAALSASGLLEHRIGGPSVFPPMPPEVAAISYANNFQWTTSEGADRYRRGMYTLFKRTAPHPTMVTFDCPDANVSNVQRNRSNTPIGALVLLNNQVYREAAVQLARAAAEKHKLDSDRIRCAFDRAIGRPINESEMDELQSLLVVSMRHFQERPHDVEQLVGIKSKSDLAALTVVTRTILNLDEFVTRE